MLPWLREKIAFKKARWLRRNDESKSQNDSGEDSKAVKVVETSNDVLQLRIINPRLGMVNLQVSYFDSGHQIKEKALKKLESIHQHSSATFSDDIQFYKLIRSCKRRPFSDFDTVLGSNVINFEEFLLITRRTDDVSHLLNIHNTRGPTEKDIMIKTKHLPLIRSSNCTKLNVSMDSALFQGDLQNDLRKILSEIAKFSAYILGSLPFAEKLIKYYRQKIIMSLTNHQDIVKLLCDMGFSRENVHRALKLQGNNYSLALDWLVENVSKNSNSEQSSLEVSSESTDDLNESTYKRLCSTTFPSSNSIFYTKHKSISIREKVEGLLEIVKYYSEKNEQPNTVQDTKNSLCQMGFEMVDIEEALRITSNNQTKACEWLLEHRSNTSNSHALREAIFVESHILKILLLTPQIQMTLSQPKFFIAYCAMLENYSSLNIFFNDIESQTILQQILRIYHEEKIYFNTFSKPDHQQHNYNQE